MAHAVYDQQGLRSNLTDTKLFCVSVVEETLHNDLEETYAVETSDWTYALY
jgi:hypothetical protein